MRRNACSIAPPLTAYGKYRRAKIPNKNSKNLLPFQPLRSTIKPILALVLFFTLPHVMPTPSPHPPTTSSIISPWEQLDRALGRLESAILTQQHNKTTDSTLETKNLQQQNTHLKTTLRQTLADLKTLLNG